MVKDKQTKKSAGGTDMFRFLKKILISAFKTFTNFVKSLYNNAAGVCLLAGSAIGFTKLATELPFIVSMPLWIEATMVAPIIGIASVFILIQLMNLQLKGTTCYE